MHWVISVRTLPVNCGHTVLGIAGAVHALHKTTHQQCRISKPPSAHCVLKVDCDYSSWCASRDECNCLLIMACLNIIVLCALFYLIGISVLLYWYNTYSLLWLGSKFAHKNYIYRVATVHWIQLVASLKLYTPHNYFLYFHMTPISNHCSRLYIQVSKVNRLLKKDYRWDCYK